MSRKPNGYWTYERCKEICLKYQKKNLLQKEYSGVSIINKIKDFKLIYDSELNSKIKELYG